MSIDRHDVDDDDDKKDCNNKQLFTRIWLAKENSKNSLLQQQQHPKFSS